MTLLEELCASLEETIVVNTIVITGTAQEIVE